MAERYAEEVQSKLHDAYQLEQELHETSIIVMDCSLPLVHKDECCSFSTFLHQLSSIFEKKFFSM